MSNKKVIIVSRELSETELKIISNKVNHYDIICIGKYYLPEGLCFKVVKSFVSNQEKTKINYNLLKEIIEFGDRNIEGKSVVDLLKYEKLSIWHYQKFRVYFFIRNSFYEIEYIKKSIMNEYSEVELFTNNSGWNYYPYDKSKIRIHFNTSKKAKTNLFLLFKYIIFFVIRSFYGLFQLNRIKKVKHIIIDHSIKQTMLNIDTLKPVEGNYNLQYLFDKIDKDFIILDEKETPKLKGKSKFFNLKFRFKTLRNTLFSEIILLKGLMSKKVIKESSKIVKSINDNIQVINDTELLETQRYFFNYFKSLSNSNKLFVFKYLSYRKFFKKFPNINSISSIDENSPRIKSILDAAKQNDIITIGIQHGTMHELHPSYMYSQNDKSKDIVSNYTLVWGNYWKRFLEEKGNYRNGSLKIFGQIRTDIIPKLIQENLKDLSFNPKNKKVVLYASQFQRDENLRRQAAIDLFESIKKIDGTLLVIKLHPSEKNEFDYYHNLASLSNCTNYKILYDYDLYKLIAISDIITTCFSTVGTEAIYFNKPLITIDHLKQDIQGYKKQGVAIQVSTQYELENSIKELLEGDMTIDKEKYSSFISEYANKIDGNISNRIIEFIKEIK